MENRTVDWSQCDADKFLSETDSCNKHVCGEGKAPPEICQYCAESSVLLTVVNFLSEPSTTESPETATEMTTTIEPTEEPSSEEEECEVYEDEEEVTEETTVSRK